MPGHGWHDNVLKGLTKLGCGVVNWPPLEPWFIPPAVPRTPEEEAEVYRLWIDKARGRGLAYVSLVWHPWSHYRFSADCRSVRLTLEYAKEIGMPADTFASWAAGHSRDL
jgi:hypothetical protein